MSTMSISSSSTSSVYGSDASPDIPGWIPQSNMMVLPLKLSTWHDRPTSCPAPSGMNVSLSSSEPTSSSAARLSPPAPSTTTSAPSISVPPSIAPMNQRTYGGPPSPPVGR